MVKNFKTIILISLLFFTFLLISITSYSNSLSNSLSEHFLRLHIIANSNSKIDQELKLKIRDNILNYINSTINKNSSKEETIVYIENNLESIKNICIETINKEGFNYSVNLNIDNTFFPTKHYYNLSLPAGYYDALKIEIGNSNGENWWCCLYPPLCFIDIADGKINTDYESNLREDLSTEEFEIIRPSKPSIKFKFKLLELF